MTHTDLLLDASNLIARSYFSARGFGTRNAVRDRLREYRHALQPRHVIAAIDAPTNFRKQLDPTYKGTRGSKPQALEDLLNHSADLMHELGCICAQADDHEADDVIATLAERAPERVVIVSTDADLHACVRERVSIYSPANRKTFGPDEYAQRYGFPRDRHSLYKALCGCASDNIPGVPDIGHSRACQVVRQAGSVEAVYAQLTGFDHRTQQGLRQVTPDQLQHALTLTTLVIRAPVRRLHPE
ncbi:5'-3' exonuclease [Deinococcus ficus]|uniref:5'-3' exonuclease domain-containing protein n=1 Tax=Deinococcus ficus TaxID=317577 RepID=A0A221T2Z2_9DEIO|nr:5'-3' exonuclease H3TH domain-containing protein [Deinococcus ficus]ASN83216.1 hypothetical protein DFI_18635 [Deinococcus ficus]